MEHANTSHRRQAFEMEAHGERKQGAVEANQAGKVSVPLACKHGSGADTANNALLALAISSLFFGMFRIADHSRLARLSRFDSQLVLCRANKKQGKRNVEYNERVADQSMHGDGQSGFTYPCSSGRLPFHKQSRENRHNEKQKHRSAEKNIMSDACDTNRSSLEQPSCHSASS